MGSASPFLTFCNEKENLNDTACSENRSGPRRPPMKVAVTTSGDSLAAPLDSRFGRAPKFLIYELEADSFLMIDNAQNLNAAQGAGIQAAQTVAEAGVQGVITGHCGPKAFRVLRAADIAVYHTDALTVREAIDRLKRGELEPAADADVEGHWI